MDGKFERIINEDFCIQVPKDLKGAPLEELAGIQLKLSETQDRIQDEVERVFTEVIKRLEVEADVIGTNPFEPMVPDDDDFSLSFRLNKPDGYEGSLDEWKAKIEAKLQAIFCPDVEPVREIEDMTIREIAEAVMAPEHKTAPEKKPDWRNEESEFCILDVKDTPGDLIAVIDARRIYGAYQDYLRD